VSAHHAPSAIRSKQGAHHRCAGGPPTPQSEKEKEKVKNAKRTYFPLHVTHLHHQRGIPGAMAQSGHCPGRIGTAVPCYGDAVLLRWKQVTTQQSIDGSRG
jgi:hypothetical protein